MNVYIFIPTNLDKSKPQNPLVKIDAISDEEASKKAKELGAGELFRKVFLEETPQKKKNGFLKG